MSAKVKTLALQFHTDEDDFQSFAAVVMARYPLDSVYLVREQWYGFDAVLEGTLAAVTEAMIDTGQAVDAVDARRLIQS